mmetsp:Transcript_22331/g.89912  ORF Transcript_22331/g.89912 Transcript_22331/m.89912 type:complete len:281 (-) Transcript_22331:44-886(-)
MQTDVSTFRNANPDVRLEFLAISVLVLAELVDRDDLSIANPGGVVLFVAVFACGIGLLELRDALRAWEKFAFLLDLDVDTGETAVGENALPVLVLALEGESKWPADRCNCISVRGDVVTISIPFLCRNSTGKLETVDHLRHLAVVRFQKFPLELLLKYFSDIVPIPFVGRAVANNALHIPVVVNIARHVNVELQYLWWLALSLGAVFVAVVAGLDLAVLVATLVAVLGRTATFVFNGHDPRDHLVLACRGFASNCRSHKCKHQYADVRRSHSAVTLCVQF